MTEQSRTIAAIATPQGQGGIGIVRLSGSRACAIGEQLVHKTLKPRYAHFCCIFAADGSVIDEAVVIFYRAPRSFTGEDVVEIQGHGGMVLPNLVLARCLELGATMASAGEFSARAFANNKLDLLQAEAISDAISAASVAQAQSAVRSLSGVFSQKVNAISDELILLRLYVEAMIDFSDEEDVDFLADGALISRLDAANREIDAALAAVRQGALLKNGVNVVLAGRPNAGKSSLLNALAGQERAIVTDIAGTTRDTLSATLVLGGLTVELTDTAGLRSSGDKVEQIGIDRAKKAIESADLLVIVYDLTEQMPDLYTLLGEKLANSVNINKQNVLYVGNKVDLTAHKSGKVTTVAQNSRHSNVENSAENGVYLSSVTGAGLADFVDLLHQKVGFYPNENAVIARTRHVDALTRAQNFLQEAHTQLIAFEAGELAAESLRLAQAALGEMTGALSSDELLGKIFASFCIGK